MKESKVKATSGRPHTDTTATITSWFLTVLNISLYITPKIQLLTIKSVFHLKWWCRGSNDPWGQTQPPSPPRPKTDATVLFAFLSNIGKESAWPV